MVQDAKLARHFTAVGTSLAWVTCRWWGAPSSGISRFRLTERLTGLKMNEIILTGRNHPPPTQKNKTKKKKKKKKKKTTKKTKQTKQQQQKKTTTTKKTKKNNNNKIQQQL